MYVSSVINNILSNRLLLSKKFALHIHLLQLPKSVLLSIALIRNVEN